MHFYTVPIISFMAMLAWHKLGTWNLKNA